MPLIGWLNPTIRHSVQQGILLRRIVDRIRNSLELRVVLQTAVDEIVDLLKLDGGLFFWYFPEHQRVQVVCERVRHHPSYLGHYAVEHLGSVASFIQAGERVVSAGRTTTPSLFAKIKRWLTANREFSPQTVVQFLDVEAVLLVPVQGLEDSIGFVACLSNQPRRWRTIEVDFMQSISQPLEIAIRQAQLYERTRKQAWREQLLNQITSETRQSFDLKKILSRSLVQLLDALAVDRCIVHLLNSTELVVDGSEDKHSERPVFCRDHLLEVCRESCIPSIDYFDSNGPIARWVMQTRQSVTISDIAQDTRIAADSGEYEQARIRSSLVVPVQTQDELHAVLYLNQCSHIRYWSKDDQKLAQAVADQLAISIQQVQLYTKTQKQAATSTAQAIHLAETLKNLKEMQAQVIQSEKMSSLGQIVAGLAHEINNPISFIYGNIPYIEGYVKDLIRLLEGFQAQIPLNQELQELVEEVELDFILQDLPLILDSMREGSNRIRDIVLSLRRFSRLDEAECKAIDVHECLESALSLLQHQLQPDIVVIRNYTPLPFVECYPRLLNQVFMNLLINAIEALGQQPEPRMIKITTRSMADQLTGEPWVSVAIADNGCGIPPAIHTKIFDPFFTTKPIGQGAGLGLAVCYQTIVGQHHGHLRFRSEPGQETEFIVEIPMMQLDFGSDHLVYSQPSTPFALVSTPSI
jgi:signal transduction histidine kinase